MLELLDSYKVLDLTNERGFLCGKILADLGAEVVRVDRPETNISECMWPFYEDKEGHRHELYRFSYNIGKKSITLDITKSEGKRIFKELVPKFDVVIESDMPGYLASLGLGYDELSKTHKSLIVTSISPFGQTGPYSTFKDSDLTITALSGFLYLTGDTDRPPVRITFPQAYLHASVEAATGTLMALYHRESIGEGQHVDVSAQQCMSWLLREAHQFWDLLQVTVKRQGSGVRRPSNNVFQRYIWACRDGYMAFSIIGGKPGAATNRAIVKWMDEEGAADDLIRAMDWDEYDMNTVDAATEEHVESLIEQFLQQYTSREIYDWAIKNKVSLLPVSNIKDITEDRQLLHRDYWEDVYHPDLGMSIRYPGSPFYIDGSRKKDRLCPPLPGEHNEEIYARELGLSPADILSLKKRGVL